MATSPSLFRILKGAEKKDNNTKQSVMLDKDKSGLAIQEGTIYVTTDDGNMYIDVSPTKRVKIGALADRALRADKDENGNQLITTYIASLKYEAQTNTTDAANLPSIKGIAMDGKTVISTIPLPSASTGNNGLVSTTAQTFGGNKTFKDNLAVTGNTALTGTLGVTGKTTLSDALDVTGTTTLKSTLGVTGNTTLGGTLGVTGATTLTGNLTANGSVTMARSLTINGMINSLIEKSAPFVVKSTTWVENLNADKVDGYDVTNNDFSAAKDTDMSIPSVGAVIKTFLPLLQSIQGLRYRGSVDLTQTTDDGRFGKDVLGTVKVGDVFMISKGGAYAGIYLEPADMLVCVAKSGNAITWNYIQSNINGAVTIKGATESNTGANPLVSVDSIPIFSAATGRQITGSKIFIDGTGHLLPASGNTKQCLGSDTRKWITVYANTFEGTDFNGTNFTGTTFKGTDFTGTTFTGTTFTGNAASASKWKTARTITVTGADTGSVTLDGSKDVTLNLTVAHTHNYAGSSSAGGAANSANKLNTNAGSTTQPVYFANGVPVVCTSFTGNAATATKLAAARSIGLGGNLTGSANFDGSNNITITAYNYQAGINGGNTKNYPWRRIASCEIGTSQGNDKTVLLRIRHLYNTGGEGLIKISVRTNSTDAACQATAVWLYRYNIPKDAVAVGLWGATGQQVYVDVYYNVNQTYPRAIVESISNGRVYTLIASKEVNDTTTSDKKTSVECYTSVANGGTLARKQDYTSITYSVDGISSTANAANMLATARNINGTAFNGTADIVTSYWGTARNITVGNTTKSVNGSANVSWSLSEIGAAAASHSHSYLPLSGGTMTGEIISTSANSLRLVTASSTNTKSVILRNDGASFYILLANSASAGDNWYYGTGGAHPFRIDLTSGYVYTSKVYGAVWNDYAEYRKTKKEIIPGKCAIETGKGDLIISTERLQPGANIVSDTFGFAIGETEKTKTPLAVSGRVLAYPYEDRDSYRAGDPVCSGPNGTISKMTREEVREYPDRIVGTISEIPNYEEWGTGKVKVNGRIWIKVK